ncbi:hypothetical protein LCGC14_2879450, partial [marine sediment metagenome]
ATGDPGVAGDTGATGVQGEPGPAGPQGDTGATGSQGSTGATGSQGEQGDTGATGAQGEQGVKGDTGDTGPAGGYGDVLLTGVIQNAAFRLLATQNEDGGWPWTNPDTDPTTGVPSPKNTLGVTAQGMLDSYKLLGLPRYLEASVATDDLMVVNSTNPDPTWHRIRGPDIPFLVELSEATGNSTYADFAKARYESAITEFGGGTATGFAEFIRDIRKGSYPELISWDINFYIQGVLALDRYFGTYGADAVAMAEVIYTSLYVSTVDFDISDPNQEYYGLAITGALEAFATTGDTHSEVATLTAMLLLRQQPDGSFLSGPVWNEVLQPTAYTVMVLVKVGEDRAAASAVNYLVGSQESNGGWLEDGVEYTEAGSEIAQAIYDFIK